MNIIFYAWALDGLAGNSIHICELSRNLLGLGHNVTVIVEPKDTKYECGGIEVKYVEYINVRMLGMISFELHAFLAGLFIAIRQKTRPDIIYMRHSLFFNCGYFLSKLLRIPVITEVNGLIVDESRLRESKSNRLIDRIERFNLARTDKFIAVTSRLKQVLMKEYDIAESKITVVQNGANTRLFKPIDTFKTRRELNLANDCNYVCFAGGLAPWQGVEYLIHAAPRILKEILDTKFLIVGDGPKKQELVELAEKTGVSDNFIFTGTVPYEEVPKYINASDVCVVPKRPLKSGYSPLKLYEYMACGKPVVASRLEGFEILEKQKAGILVEPENPEDLAKAIIKLLEDKKLREEMGGNGREYVVKNHSWENVAKKVAEVCESTVREHKNKRR